MGHEGLAGVFSAVTAWLPTGNKLVESTLMQRNLSTYNDIESMCHRGNQILT